MLMSASTRSAENPFAIAGASRPSSANATSCPAVRSVYATMSRIDAESSTARIRAMSLSLLLLFELEDVFQAEQRGHAAQLRRGRTPFDVYAALPGIAAERRQQLQEGGVDAFQFGAVQFHPPGAFQQRLQPVVQRANVTNGLRTAERDRGYLAFLASSLFHARSSMPVLAGYRRRTRIL